MFLNSIEFTVDIDRAIVILLFDSILINLYLEQFPISHQYILLFTSIILIIIDLSALIIIDLSVLIIVDLSVLFNVDLNEFGDSYILSKGSG